MYFVEFFLFLILVAAITGLVIIMVIRYVIKARRDTAMITKDKVQEITIVVNGRYRPDKIVLRKGIPARLNFLRQENNPCSERLIFSTFNVDRHLPAFWTTPITFTPNQAGEFLFTCEMGLYRGKIIVKEDNSIGFKYSSKQDSSDETMVSKNKRRVSGGAP